MRQGRCLAAASVGSGGRLLAVESAAAGQAGTQAARSCPKQLACKVLRYQPARPSEKKHEIRQQQGEGLVKKDLHIMDYFSVLEKIEKIPDKF